MQFRMVSVLVLIALFLPFCLQGEVESFLRTLSRTKGAPTDLNPHLAMSISNVICSMMMSLRFHQDDSRFKRFMYLIEEGFKLVSVVAAVNFIPVMKYLPKLKTTFEKLAKVRRRYIFFDHLTIKQLVYQAHISSGSFVLTSYSL